MDQRDAGQVAEKLWKALQAGDWESAGGYLHDDFVQEWPQSGERIVGRDNAIAVEPAEQLLAAGQRAEGSAQLERALAFCRQVDATAYLRQGAALLTASA